LGGIGVWDGFGSPGGDEAGGGVAVEGAGWSCGLRGKTEVEHVQYGAVA